MSKETFIRTNRSLDGDLSSVVRQSYAEPSAEYWGVFTPAEESDAPQRDLGGPLAVSDLEQSLACHLVPGASRCDLAQVELQQPSHSSAAEDPNDALPLYETGHGLRPQQVEAAALPSRRTHNSQGRGNELNKRRRPVKIRHFHGSAASQPPLRPLPPVWPAVVNQEGQQLLQQYHHLHTSTDPSSSETEDGSVGLQLVHLLLACADAVDSMHFDLVHAILKQLEALIVPRTSTMQRLAAIFATALTARITKTAEGGLYMGIHRDLSVPVAESLKYFHVAYNYTPFGKIMHTMLNQIILEAVEKDPCIHIIDLHTEWRGMQWPAFIHALAIRPGVAPRLRITAFGKPDDLAHCQDKLHLYAQNVRFPLEFCPIAADLRDFNLGLLDIREEEAICINSFGSLHQCLSVGDPQVHRLLSDLKSLNPRVFAISDNDAYHNSSYFPHRFVECLKYYSAMFDALEACIPETTARLHIEQMFAGQKIRNIIACEGDARIERHETFADLNRRMVAAGFHSCPVNVRAINQASLQLTLYHVDGFTLSINDGSVGLGWKGITLLGLASWCSSHCGV